MTKEKLKEITRTEDLPFIPMRIRDFAYKYAVRVKHKRSYWAAKYKVKICTIEKWLKRPGVRSYIKIVQTEERKKVNYLEEIRERLKGKKGLQVSNLRPREGL